MKIEELKVLQASFEKSSKKASGPVLTSAMAVEQLTELSAALVRINLGQDLPIAPSVGRSAKKRANG